MWVPVRRQERSGCLSYVPLLVIGWSHLDVESVDALVPLLSRHTPTRTSRAFRVFTTQAVTMVLPTFSIACCLLALAPAATSFTISMMSTPPFPRDGRLQSPSGGTSSWSNAPAPSPLPPPQSSSASSTDYLSNLSPAVAANSLKPGPNYMGMGRSLKTNAVAPSPSTSYLAGVTASSGSVSGGHSSFNNYNAATAAKSFSYQSVTRQPTTTAATPSDASYRYTPAVVANSYTAPLPQSSPSTSGSSYTYQPTPAATPAAPSGGDYLSALSGASGSIVGAVKKNYSGMGRSFAPSSGASVSGSYLDQMATAATTSTPPASTTSYVYSPPAPPTTANAVPASYTYAYTPPVPASPVPTSYTYSPAPPSPESSSVSSGSDYLSALGGSGGSGSGTAKKNYSGMGRSFKTSTAPANAYLDQVASAPPPAPSPSYSSYTATPSYSAPPAPSSVPSYTSYTTPSYASTTTGPVSSGTDYLSTLGGAGGSATKSGKNYSGMGRSFKTSSAPATSYLDQVASTPPAPIPSYSSYTATPSYATPPVPSPVPSYTSSTTPSYASTTTGPVSSGTDYLSTLGGASGGGTAKKNYSGMGRSFKTSSAPANSYLDQMASSVPNPSYSSYTATPSYAAPAAGPVSGYSSYTAPSYASTPGPVGPVSSGVDYLSALGGGSASGNAVKSGKNYSGMGRSFKTTNAPSSYLDQMAASQTLPTPHVAPNLPTSYVAQSAPNLPTSYVAQSAPDLPTSYVAQSAPSLSPPSYFGKTSQPSERKVSDDYLKSIGKAMKSGRGNYNWFGNNKVPAARPSPDQPSAYKTPPTPNYAAYTSTSNSYSAQFDGVHAQEANNLPTDPQSVASSATQAAKSGPASPFGVIPPNNPFNYMGTLSGNRGRSRTSLGNTKATNADSESMKQNDAEAHSIPTGDGPRVTFSADWPRQAPSSGKRDFWWEEHKR
jgi:hypothetical protein